MKLGTLIKRIRAVERSEKLIRAMKEELERLQMSDLEEQEDVEALKQQIDEAENDLNYLNEEEI